MYLMSELIQLGESDTTIVLPPAPHIISAEKPGDDLIKTVQDAGFDVRALQESHSKFFPRLGLEITPQKRHYGDHLATLVDIDNGRTVEELLAEFGVLLLKCLKLENGPSWTRYKHKLQEAVGKRRNFHSDSQPYVGLYNDTGSPRASSRTGFADKAVYDEELVQFLATIPAYSKINHDPATFTASFLDFVEKRKTGVFISLQPDEMSLWRNSILPRRGRLMHCQNFSLGVTPTEEGNVMRKFSIWSFSSPKPSMTYRTN